MLQKKTISLTTIVYRPIMLCNDGKCKKVRNGEDRHTLLVIQIQQETMS